MDFGPAIEVQLTHYPCPGVVNITSRKEMNNQETLGDGNESMTHSTTQLAHMQARRRMFSVIVTAGSSPWMLSSILIQKPQFNLQGIHHLLDCCSLILQTYPSSKPQQILNKHFLNEQIKKCPYHISFSGHKGHSTWSANFLIECQYDPTLVFTSVVNENQLTTILFCFFSPEVHKNIVML